MNHIYLLDITVSKFIIIVVILSFDTPITIIFAKIGSKMYNQGDFIIGEPGLEKIRQLIHPHFEYQNHG